MNKVTGFILVLVLTLLLTACGESEETRKFQLEDTGVTVTIIYTYKGDKATKQSAENLISYEALGLTSKEEAKEIFDPLIEQFQGIDGVTHKMEYTDTSATEYLTVDFTETDFEEIQDLPGMDIDADAANGVSMEKSAEELKEQGFKEID